MDQNYIPPAAALKKLKMARSIPQTVYLYGATGYGKTELVRQYLSNRKYTYFSCEELPWDLGTLPRSEPNRQNRRVVVIDDLHRLKSGELRREILALEEREDIWLILISRSPIPAWLMPRHIKDVFVVISEKDLRMGRVLDETEEMARRYPLYLKKRTATVSDFGGTALTILRLQADGLSVNQIAQSLGMKPFTVSYHIQENYRKLNVSRKADALLAARSLEIL